MLSAVGYMSADIVHYGSARCYRALRTVMSAEVHAFVHTFDTGFTIREALEKSLGRLVKDEAFVSGCMLFNFIDKNSSTAERKSQISVCALKKVIGKRNCKKLE